MKNNPKYEQFKNQLAKIADLGFAGAVLAWDQQTYMPKNGVQARGRQMATLQTLAHEHFVEANFGKLLEELSLDSGLSEIEQLNVRLTLKDYRRKQKYPHAFVVEHARICSDAFPAWAEARAKKDFKIFEPTLKKIVELKRKEAAFLGFTSHPYEALLDDYESGLTVAEIDRVFDEVKRDLFPFIKKIATCAEPRADFLTRHFPKDQQFRFSEKIVKQMGYDDASGRADFAPHPFSTTLGPGDTRITIRVNENHFNEMFFAAIHEAGHALYELGLPLAENYGLPFARAVSIGFHESQSRLWENQIARSLPFWKGNFESLRSEFPTQLKDVTAEEFYRAVNRVGPSFIRVEADELTYHAHIYIRYLVEKSLLEGSLEVKDVPQFWNDRYDEYLGIRPPNDALGCLQDVHWSYGSFGYFPTYSLGSFYAVQLDAQMRKDIPTLDQEIEKANLAPVLRWLREKVHALGHRYDSNELLKRLTQNELQFSYFMDYAKKKYGAIYGIA